MVLENFGARLDALFNAQESKDLERKRYFEPKSATYFGKGGQIGAGTDGGTDRPVQGQIWARTDDCMQGHIETQRDAPEKYQK